jgi:hypothetical protein
MATVEVVVKCDQCGVRVKGNNTDSWAGQLPMPSVPPTKEELAKNQELKRPKYSITKTDLCFPCATALGDWLSSQRKA